jgi:hypothetical protein
MILRILKKKIPMMKVSIKENDIDFFFYFVCSQFVFTCNKFKAHLRGSSIKFTRLVQGKHTLSLKCGGMPNRAIKIKK